LYLYAHKLKDFQMAESYCARHYNPDKEDARDVYVNLLSVYLKPADSEINRGTTTTTTTNAVVSIPMIGPALALLSKHYQHIDVPKALELLPPNTPVGQLYDLIESVIRNNTKNRRNNQVVKNLLKSESLQVRDRLIQARSKSVKIYEDRMCPVCTKRLGNSAFACYPNGVIVHYSCFRDKFVCPHTGTVFNK